MTPAEIEELSVHLSEFIQTESGYDNVYDILILPDYTDIERAITKYMEVKHGNSDTRHSS